jgi:hypothetical protein
MTDINRVEIFQKNNRLHPFWPQKERRDFGIVESRTSWRETNKIQIKLYSTCNKNKQQGAKSHADL